MPQLMPLYWINSVLMIFVVIFSIMLLYSFKNLEYMKCFFYKKNTLYMFNFMW